MMPQQIFHLLFQLTKSQIQACKTSSICRVSEFFWKIITLSGIVFYIKIGTKAHICHFFTLR
jgi:hypothetical protein